MGLLVQNKFSLVIKLLVKRLIMVSQPNLLKVMLEAIISLTVVRVIDPLPAYSRLSLRFHKDRL